MTKEEKQYLLEEFPKVKGRTLRGDTLRVYYETERILNNKEKIHKRSCTCEYRSLAIAVNKQYENWLQNNA